MRLALLSDIHGNLEALGAVVGEGRARGVDAWVCLGDIVGYGANPQACLHAVQELTDEVVLGNHDAAAIGQTDLANFNPHARRAAEWTAEQLGESERRYLASLPFVLQRDDAFFVHAEPHQPSRWGYVHDRAEAKKALDAIEQRFCFVGHSHCPFVCIERDGGVELLPKGPQPIQPRSRYLANIGSVGQPRDGDAQACFALWDQAAETLELVRCPYDITTTQHKIITAGLPPALAERLALGH
jgi:diadenosine tetraphosphatase ApaH/serine/threonine PP2A family protein phosphatase